MFPAQDATHNLRTYFNKEANPMTKDDKELKPLKSCPFCGMPVKIDYSEGLERIGAFICPDNSPCKKTRLMSCFPKENEAEAIKAWNQRTPDKAVELLERWHHWYNMNHERIHAGGCKYFKETDEYLKSVKG